MLEKESHILRHYQKLQESLTELMDPDFGSQARSLMYILLNQTYTNTERLFELVEESVNLSKPRQAMLAKLAHHIENTKERGVCQDFREFISGDLSLSLAFIRDLFAKDFGLAS